MRNTMLAGLALAVSMAAGAALAAPAPQPGVGLGGFATLVEGGCGPGGYRASDGRCYPRRPPPPPPYRRMCPPGYHPSPYGCRPNY